MQSFGRAGSDITWIAPGSLVAILLLSVVGIGLPYFIGEPLSDKFVATIGSVMLLIVAIADFAVVRFVVLPAQFRAYREPKPGMARLSYDQMARGAKVVSYAFPVATALYGAVAALQTGQGLLALPFAAIAIVSHVGIGSYLRESLETLRRDISVGSTA